MVGYPAKFPDNAGASEYYRKYRALGGDESLAERTLMGLLHTAIVEGEGVLSAPRFGPENLLYEGNKEQHRIVCNAIAERLIYDSDDEVSSYEKFFSSENMVGENVKNALADSQALINDILAKKLEKCQEDVGNLQKYCQERGLEEEEKLADQLSEALESGSDVLSSLRAFNMALFGHEDDSPSIADQLLKASRDNHPSTSKVKDFLREVCSLIFGERADRFLDKVLSSPNANPLEEVVRDFQSTPRFGSYESIHHKVPSMITETSSEEKGIEESLTEDPDEKPTPSPKP